MTSRIAIADGDGILEFRLFTESVKIDSDTHWRADLVLAAVALADIAVVVPRFNLPTLFLRRWIQ